MADEKRRPGRPPKSQTEGRAKRAPVKVYLNEEQRQKLAWLKGASSNSTYLARLIEREAEAMGYEPGGDA